MYLDTSSQGARFELELLQLVTRWKRGRANH